MRSTYCKARARTLRWREEITLLLEEMRRVVTYFVWKRNWWLGRRNLRPQVKADIQSGANAYAERQALVFEGLAKKFAKRWKTVVVKQGLSTRWPNSIDTVIASLSSPTSVAGQDPVSTPVPTPISLDATRTVCDATQPTSTTYSISEQERAVNSDETHEESRVVDNQEMPSDMALAELDEDEDEISDEGSDDDDLDGYLGPDHYESD